MHENKIIFLLGAGASIASSNKKLLKHLGILSMNNFIEIMMKMSEDDPYNLENDLSEDGFDFKECGRIFDINLNLIRNIRGIKSEKNLNNISDIYNYYEKNNSLDENIISKLIYQTVSKYFHCFDRKYYKKLFKFCKDHKSNVISLNWDFNFERVVSENIDDIRQLYGNSVKEHFLKSEKINSRYLFKILKPHGSLNWYFLHNHANEIVIGNLNKEDYYLYISKNNNPDEQFDEKYALLPPRPWIDVQLLSDNDLNEYDPYFIRKLDLIKNIYNEVREMIKEASILVVIGYSFPKEDNHILDLFKNNNLSKLFVLDKDRNVFNKICEYDCFSNLKEKQFTEDGFEGFTYLEEKMKNEKSYF